MDLRRRTNQKRPRVGLLGLPPHLAAEGQVVIHGLGELALQLLHGRPLEGDEVLGVDHAALESVKVSVVFERPNVTLVPDQRWEASVGMAGSDWWKVGERCSVVVPGLQEVDPVIAHEVD
jgi:hypothetical protein